MLKKGLTIALIGIFISGALIFTGCRSHSHQHKAEFMVDYIAETIDATDEQRAQLDGIKDEFVAKAKEMHEQKEAMHAAFIAELRKEQISRETLNGLIDQKRAQMDAFINMALDHLIDFHQTLTEEQREKLAAKIEYFHEKHQHKWE